MLKVILLGSSISLLASCKVHSQHHEQMTHQFDSLITLYMNQTLIPGVSIGVVKDGEVIYARGFGYTDSDHTKEVTKNTIFHSASISKLFTATAIMQFAESGAIDIEKKISYYIPEIELTHPTFSRITIKQLLNHTSGLSDVKNYKWRRSNQSLTAIHDYFIKLNPNKLKYKPGAYHYSNIGYSILGYLLEKLASELFEDYMKDQVLSKTEMGSSTFQFSPTNEWAQPFSKRKVSGKIYQRNVYPYTREHAPSSTLHTTSNDLNKWMLHLLDIYHTKNNGIITFETLQLMWTSSLAGASKIGLGWSLGKYKGNEMVYHFGGDKGFRSFLVIFPEAKIGVTILMNGDFAEELRQTIAFFIADTLLP